ncbi:MAG: hypothetical protein ACK6A7_20235, partial [Planctomycetota bacterium]
MGYFRDWMGWSSGSLEKVERLSSAVPTLERELWKRSTVGTKDMRGISSYRDLEVWQFAKSRTAVLSRSYPG